MTIKETILIVDDNHDNLSLLVRTLESEGYEVLPADSGELALSSVSARRPDLVLLDIRMPVMDGFEVCRRLKADQQTRGNPGHVYQQCQGDRGASEGLSAWRGRLYPQAVRA